MGYERYRHIDLYPTLIGGALLPEVDGTPEAYVNTYRDVAFLVEAVRERVRWALGATAMNTELWVAMASTVPAWDSSLFPKRSEIAQSVAAYVTADASMPPLCTFGSSPGSSSPGMCGGPLPLDLNWSSVTENGVIIRFYGADAPENYALDVFMSRTAAHQMPYISSNEVPLISMDVGTLNRLYSDTSACRRFVMFGNVSSGFGTIHNTWSALRDALRASGDQSYGHLAGPLLPQDEETHRTEDSWYLPDGGGDLEPITDTTSAPGYGSPAYHTFNMTYNGNDYPCAIYTTNDSYLVLVRPKFFKYAYSSNEAFLPSTMSGYAVFNGTCYVSSSSVVHIFTMVAPVQLTLDHAISDNSDFFYGCAQAVYKVNFSLDMMRAYHRLVSQAAASKLGYDAEGSGASLSINFGGYMFVDTGPLSCGTFDPQLFSSQG